MISPERLEILRALAKDLAESDQTIPNRFIRAYLDLWDAYLDSIVLIVQEAPRDADFVVINCMVPGCINTVPVALHQGRGMAGVKVGAIPTGWSLTPLRCPDHRPAPRETKSLSGEMQ